MAAGDLNEFSANQFCGNCGTGLIPGATVCESCGAAVPEAARAELPSVDYIPYCRACGVPVAKEAALNCPKCGVSPLCREHYNPSTRTCALCPPFELSAEEQQAPPSVGQPKGPWPQPRAAVPCPQCGARIREGVQFCPNCGSEQAGAEETSEYAGFLVRLGAAIIDSLITGVPAAIITSFTEIPAFGTVLSVVYYVLFTYYRGQTPGKMLLDIHVVDENGQKPNLRQVILREVVGKAVSALVLLIGYLWIIWDPKKRGWHDYFGNTYVVKRERV
ncbi:MAG: zinc-ribbon domain-containing protein [SAR202 cluster bacterium]|nr:zinc-ribbon domain-containing protein [SAR202 cluster bacterium]